MNNFVIKYCTKRKLPVKSIFTSFLCILTSFVFAQTPISINSAPQTIYVCGQEQSISLKVDDANVTSFTLEMPAGLEFTGDLQITQGGAVTITTAGPANNPEFNFGTGLTTTHVFSIKVKATCDIIPLSQANLLCHWISGGISSAQHISFAANNSINIKFPTYDLQVVNAGTQFQGIKGQIINRKLSLINTGTGDGYDIYIDITYPKATGIDINAVDLVSNGIQITKGNSTVSLLYESLICNTAAPVYTYRYHLVADNNPTVYPYYGQQVIITESTEVKNCINPSAILQTEYKVSRGCNGGNCSAETNATKVIDFQQLTNQNILISVPGAFTPILPSGSVPGERFFKLYNPNSFTALNVHAIIDALGDVNIVSVSEYDPLGGANLWIPYSGLSGTSATTPDIDLDAFENVVYKVEYTVACSGSGNCSGLENGLKANGYYNFICGGATLFSSGESVVKDKITSDAPTGASGPVDMVFNEASTTQVSYPFTFSPSLSVSNSMFGTLSSNGYYIEFQLPTDVVLASTTATFVNNGSTNITITAGSTSGTYTMPLPSSGLKGTYTILLSLSHDCANAATNDFANITWILKQDNNGCTNSIACADWEFFKHYTCPGGSGNSCSVTSTSFNAQRNSFGFVPPSNGYVFNYTGLNQVDANTSGIKLDAVYECDELRAAINSSIVVNTECSGEIDQSKIYAHFTYSPPAGGSVNDDMVQFISAAYSLNGGTEIPLTVTPTVIRNTPLNVIIFEFPLPAGTITNSQSLSVTALLRVNKEPYITDNQYIKRLRGELFYNPSNAALPLFGNNTWGKNVTIYKPLVINPLAIIPDYGSYVCTAKRSVYVAINSGRADDFPNEFRSFLKLDEVITNIPAGYSYVSGSSTIVVNNGTPVAIDNPAQSNNGLTLTWNRALSTINPWPLMDKSIQESAFILSYELLPTCDMAGGSPFSGEVSYTLNDHNPVSCSEPVEHVLLPGQGDVRNYLLPNLLLYNNISTPIEYGVGKTATFNFNIKNLPPLYTAFGSIAKNTWIALEAEAGIAIDNIYLNNLDVTSNAIYYGSTPGDKNKIYLQIGNISSSSAAQSVSINTSFANCSDYLNKKVIAYSNWDCNAYPDVAGSLLASFNPASMNNQCGPLKTLNLIFQQQTGGLSISYDNQTPEWMNLCDGSAAIKITVQTTGATNAALHNLVADLNVTNQQVQSLGFTIDQITYNFTPLGAANTGTYNNFYPAVSPIPAFDPLNENWPLSSVVSEMKGGDKLELLIHITSSCSYIPTSLWSFSAQGLTACDNQLGGSNPINHVVGIEGLEEISHISATLTPPVIAAPGATGTMTVQINNTNWQTGSTPVAFTNVTVRVTMDGRVTYAGTNAPTGLTPTITTNGTQKVLEYTNVTIPVTGLTFLIGVQEMQPLGTGGTASFTVQTIADKDLACINTATEPCHVNTSTFGPTTPTTTGLPTTPGGGTTDPTCSYCVNSFAPKEGGKYVLSAWVKETYIDDTDGKLKDHTNVLTYTFPAIEIVFDGAPAPNTILASPGGKIIDGWQRIEKVFDVPQGTYFIHINLYGGSGNDYDAVFDDIRIHPFNSNMKSFVYDPVSLKLVAELDANNYATMYEYDKEGNLIRVKKETERGIETLRESRSSKPKK